MRENMDKLKVLIADDHPAFCLGLQKLMREDSEMEPVGIAANGEEAIRLAKELLPDVVVMDIAMPKLNGIEATRRIKQDFPMISVLVLSAYGYSPYVFSALDAGAAGYLLKNVPLRELLNAIRAVRIGEAVLDREIADKVLRNLVKGRQGGGGKRTQLNPREMEVLGLGAKGLTNDEIADKLTLSPRTVQTHFTHIFNKLGVASRLEAILYALREGWFVLDKPS
jgi:NarL family two-component system response regulator LiaR